ncbi:uncharacterized protein KY384_007323 [Bacidia gigantensis]|uniref:uncharacterized protein n=1 Tax=Bacidia gigantensis TaxID=2732470 RepID=UPI001D04D8AC|nr:uncharacterized protein KY384_007323 [Bacidia gigantensis]KAG8528405.1 hypothetical protein KY384_007323 [Bacidia gigantensis]
MFLSTISIAASLRVSKLRILALALIIHCTNTAPTLIDPLEPRQQEPGVPFACSGDPAAVLDGACWDILDLDDYLLNPVTGWNVTTQVCDDTRICCLSGEPWTTCFLRLATGRADYSCLTIDGEDCTWDKKISDGLALSIRGKVKYVTKTIFELHNFFTKYFSALTDSIAPASTIITSMTLTIDPQKKTNLLMQLVLSAFTLGLSFLVAPALGASAIEGIQSTVLKQQASIWSISLGNAPGVAKTMWPQGDTASSLFQIGQLETQLDSATSQYQDILNNGLKLLMLDPTSFVDFAKGGGYCGNTTTDLVEQKDTIDLALRTYLTSESMGQNGWYATPNFPNTIMTEDQWNNYHPTPNCTTPATIHGCSTPKDAKPDMYWSPVSGRVYRLWNKYGDPDSLNIKTPSELMSSIVSNRWGDLPWMFDGAYNCTLTGRTADNQLVDVDIDKGVLDLSCISHLPMQRECSGACPVDVHPCPFKQYCAPNLGGGSVHGGYPTNPDPADASTVPTYATPTASPGPVHCQNAGGAAIHGGRGGLFVLRNFEGGGEGRRGGVGWDGVDWTGIALRCIALRGIWAA